MKKTKRLLTAVCILFVLFAISGCSSRSSSEDSMASTAMAAADTTNGLGAESPEKSLAQEASAVPEADTARKIVKQADLTIQTEHYDRSVSNFESLVAQFGGYLESSNIEGNGVRGGNAGRHATCVARVPAEQLDEFLNSVSDTGSVVRKSVSGDDVTQSYYDTDSRLKTLRIEQTRLQELMAKADKVEDLLSIEQRLSEVETQIESLTGELKRMDSLISLSTVTVNFEEVRFLSAGESDSLGGQIASMFRSSLSALSQTGRYLLLAVTAVLPFAVVVLVIAAVFLFFRRKFKKKKVKTPPDSGKN